MIIELAKGFYTTLSHILKKPVTVQYPEEMPDIKPRFRGRIILKRYDNGDERCVGCYLCSAVCPVECITLESGLNEKGVRFATWYKIDFNRCILCGLCITACPVLALEMTSDFEMSAYARDGLVYDKGQLLEQRLKV
jgi:NADH-quinone oxidoreductase subunit I